MLDAEAMHELARGATHIVHCAAIAGVDTVLESPVRTMRVNVIGTYNVLEAALATLDTLERFIDFSTSEVFGTHAFRVSEGEVSTIGSVGEARWTYAVSKLAGEHMAHAYHDELGLPDRHGAPVQRLRARARSAAARSARSSRRRSPGATSTIHGDGSQIRAWCYVDDMVDGVLALPRAARGGRPGVQHRQPALGGDDLRPRAADQAARRRHGRDRLPAARTTPTSSCGSRTSRRRASCSACEAQVELDDGLERTIAWYREKRTPRIRLAWPDVGEEELAAVARGARDAAS